METTTESTEIDGNSTQNPSKNLQSISEPREPRDSTNGTKEPIGSSGSREKSVPQKLGRTQIDAEAKNLSEKSELPRAPSPVVNDESTLVDWLTLLTPDMWNKLMIYVYRLYPIINRKMLDPDKDNNVDVLTKDSIDTQGGIISYMMKMHGGGKYKILLNDASKNKNQTHFTAHINVPIDSALPRLNYTELEINNPKNQGYIQLLQNHGIMNDKKQIVSPTATATPASGTPAQGSNDTAAILDKFSGVYDKILGAMGKMSSDQKAELNKGGINELFLEKMKQDSPNNQVTMLTAMMAMFEKIIPKPVPVDPANTISFQTILQMQADSHNRMLEMVTKMIGGQKEAQSPLALLTELRTALPEVFKGSGGSGETAPRSNLEIGLDIAKEFGLPILGIVSQVIQMKTGAKPAIPVNIQQAEEMVQQSGMQGQGQQPQPIRSNPQLEAARANQAAQVQQPNANSNGDNVTQMPDPNQTSNPNFSPLIHKYLLGYGQLIINAMKAGESGIAVGENIKSFTPMIGQDVYEIIRSQGKEKLLTTMELTEGFWSQTGALYGKDRMNEFVEEFLNFEKIIAEEDNEVPEGTTQG